MSHNVSIQGVKIKSLDALERAIAELRAEGRNVGFNKDGKFRTYQGQPTNCDATITLPGMKYDIGLRKNAAGEYVPILDNDIHYMANQNPIACPVTPGERRQDVDCMGALMQRYSTILMEEEASNKGYTSTRSTGKNGELLLEIETA